VEIREIREPVPVAVDDQLAKDLGVEDLGQLRRMLKEQMEREYGALARIRLKQALFDKLAAAHDFELPQGVVEAEAQSIWRQYQAEEGAAGGKTDTQGHNHDHGHTDGPDHVHGHADQRPAVAEPRSEDEAKVKADLRALAERRVRLGLLLGEVGNRHNITVTPEELSRAVRVEAMRHPGHEREVVQFLQTHPEALARLRVPLFEDKVVDFILEGAKVSDRRVSPEELLKEPGESASPEAAKDGTKQVNRKEAAKPKDS
jgi:FKBP-type peptidyl-prolyl cis-trans isomerase (trigger factor)